ncbi:CoA transferase [Paraburkholderia sp. JPY432]|uniref:CaiB/BaiF CoA transferase family protein n=1 Tax=Paraburkholderia youngii TaxID=2782701 RepID=UPI001595265B|nr:CoA transferase [Paraburkholderia youngii]NVH75752.1 CoA transferase [Paraburkholderia youngii]
MLASALTGITVADFTQIGAGPTCTMLLADMGARVIKVESPSGDLARGLGPAWIGEDSALYHSFNRNKLSICLDLKSPEGLAAAWRLIKRADVVVESMRPGVMERLGIGPDKVRQECPSIVYCSISAYGQEGPCSHQAGVDGILQAESGLMSLIGMQGSGPCKVQAPIVDVTTGYIACVGILGKLFSRIRDGQGGHLDVSLMASALALQQSSIASYLADGRLPELIGSAAPYSAPNQAFKTSNGWVMVAAYMPQRWERFCAVIGEPSLATDERFATSPLRVKHRAELEICVNSVMSKHTTEHWLDQLQNSDILCARVATYDQLSAHPQIRANRLLTRVEHPVHGSIGMPGFPINSRIENAEPARPAPLLGQHTREVLLSLGLDDPQVEAMLRNGAAVAEVNENIA